MKPVWTTLLVFGIGLGAVGSAEEEASFREGGSAQSGYDEPWTCTAYFYLDLGLKRFSRTESTKEAASAMAMEACDAYRNALPPSLRRISGRCALSTCEPG